MLLHLILRDPTKKKKKETAYGPFAYTDLSN